MTSAVFVVLLGSVCVLGFFGARWRAGNLQNLENWALGGRGFGTIVSWFLMGGDFYTAYTFVALPALMFGIGALGFFAVPYSTLAYVFNFLILSRFWVVANRNGYVTASDYLRQRYGSRSLEVATAVAAVIATVPYLALQLIGMRAVFSQLGGAFALQGGLLALVVAFALLAALTVTSGLRGPALIAFVKDTLIYVTVIAAVVVIPAKLGGWHHVFQASSVALALKPKPSSILLTSSQYFTYASMAFGSSLAFGCLPQVITSVLAAKSQAVVRRNMALLPAYTLLLGLLALLGYCALASGITTKDFNLVVPLLFERYFPDWFAGVAFAAIVVGALVPASVMAISAANLCASNIFTEFHALRTPAQTLVTKRTTLAICALALAVVLFVPVPFAIDLQLLSLALIVQIMPAFWGGLFGIRFDARALFTGWAFGTGAALAMAVAAGFSSNVTLHVGSFSLTGFIALYAVAVNIFVTTIVAAALRLAGVPLREGSGAGDYA